MTRTFFDPEGFSYQAPERFRFATFRRAFTGEWELNWFHCTADDAKQAWDELQADGWPAAIRAASH
jgi:hypothetical protein